MQKATATSGVIIRVGIFIEIYFEGVGTEVFGAFVGERTGCSFVHDVGGGADEGGVHGGFHGVSVGLGNLETYFLGVAAVGEVVEELFLELEKVFFEFCVRLLNLIRLNLLDKFILINLQRECDLTQLSLCLKVLTKYDFFNSAPVLRFLL